MYHKVHRASILRHMAHACLPYPTQLPLGAFGTLRVPSASLIWLPYGTTSSHMVHKAPIWPQYGACISHTAPIAFNMLPSGSHATPIQCLRLTLQRTRLLYGHTAPIWCMWLPYGTICLHCPALHPSHSSACTPPRVVAEATPSKRTQAHHNPLFRIHQMWRHHPIHLCSGRQDVTGPNQHPTVYTAASGGKGHYTPPQHHFHIHHHFTANPATYSFPHALLQVLKPIQFLA
jgi:hypothetical protein